MNEEFNDPRLVAVYDVLNPWTETETFYLSLPTAPSQRILDLGCGTGRLARAFAQRGHVVTGVDPAPASLEYARRQPGADQVTWLAGNAQTFRLDQQFDLITMTNHVFQFVPINEIGRVMATAAHHLAPGGRLAFESRSPLARAWDRWTPERSRQTDRVDGIGEVTSFVRVNIEEADRIQFTITYLFLAGGKTLTTTSWLYFPDLETITCCILEAGLEVESLFGDWDRSDFESRSPEMIFIGRKG